MQTLRRCLVASLGILILAAPAFAQRSVVSEEKSRLGLTTNLTPGQLNALVKAVAGRVGGGMFVKTDGTNCNGFSCDLVCFADGRLVDILADSEGAAAPDWNVKGNFLPTQKCDIIRGEDTVPVGDGGVTEARLKAAIAELHTSLWNELAGELGTLRTRIEKVEATGGGGGIVTEAPSDVDREHLAVSKAILDLLTRTALRFGVK